MVWVILERALLVDFKDLTTILYHNRSRHEDAESELNASYVSFDTLLEEESDFVVCTAPLTPETENKFNKDAFSKMKNDAIFINIGRVLL